MKRQSSVLGIETSCGDVRRESIAREGGEKLHAESPFLSVIIPCRNEEQFIARCLESIADTDYSKDHLEVLVLEGNSEDGTRRVVTAYAEKYPFIRLVENPRGFIAAALNIGIREAKGDVLMRMDAHASYSPDYMRKCVEALHSFNADNVGGMWNIVPRQETLVGRAIASCLSHPFGAGNAYYRMGKSADKPRWVDTVPYFCCRKELFQELGGFNEKLLWSEDIEFNLRLRRRRRFSTPPLGGTGGTLLMPGVVSTYYARSDVLSFCRHNWRNGVWSVLPFLYASGVPVAGRHLVPLALVVSLIGSGAAAVVWPTTIWPLVAIGVSYLFANLVASLHVAWRKQSLSLLFTMPLVFGMLHLVYGVGSLWGMIGVAVKVRSRIWRHGQPTSGQHLASDREAEGPTDQSKRELAKR